jgi:hypothetical protein
MGGAKRWPVGCCLLLSALAWVATVPAASAGEPPRRCSETVSAQVVAIDQPMVFNRLGAQNVNWMMYALRKDLVHDDPDHPDTRGKPVQPNDSLRPGKVTLRPDLRPRPLVLRIAEGQCLKATLENLLTPPGTWGSTAGANPYDATQVELLRKACTPQQKKLDPAQCSDHPMEARSHAPDGLARDDLGAPGTEFQYAWQVNRDDQVASRCVGFHPQGLELVGSIDSDSSYVGANANSLAFHHPGGADPNSFCVGGDGRPARRTYTFFAPHEGAFLVSNDGAVFGSDGTAGNSGVGLFGMVAVEPKGGVAYRSQVTEEELRLATVGRTPDGQPLIDYQTRYPRVSPWTDEGKAGLPILKMVDGNEIVHSDINAIIAGPREDGSFPPDTYPLESIGRRNPTYPNRLEPFREFASIFHDENSVAQAFPGFFEHPVLKHTLHGVRDTFMINYGSGGVGAEIIANRLGVGPMHDCVDCAYEEFFLSSFAVGDPAMIVDKPANLGLENLVPPKPGQVLPKEFEPHVGPKATQAFYPHDPANVHHSYVGDFVKFRNVHTGKEQHIFHLHNHQWLFNPNDDNSNYIDAQGIGPGSGYTYEIAFGGSGNRNKSAGDAIYHCHLYPHFAQGMWYLWRIHDVYEQGTELAVSAGQRGFHARPFDLKSGRPAEGARALPDGEIAAGVPIPAVVPLPGKALPPVPGKVYVAANPVTKPVVRLDENQAPTARNVPVGSVVKFDRIEVDLAQQHPTLNPKGYRNPGYPFWIAGVGIDDRDIDGNLLTGVTEASVGSRPTTPPKDMEEAADKAEGGWNGGLPRHALLGLAHGSAIDAQKTVFTRLSAAKVLHKAKPLYFDEQGTRMEKVAMAFHSRRNHPSYLQPMNGAVPLTPGTFITNGAPPVAGAPYHDPCVDDNGDPLDRETTGRFFTATLFDPPGRLPASQSRFDSRHPRIYKGANIQMDVEFNKVGYHYPQQRFLTLWEDVAATLDKKRPPEPFVMRMNTFDCASYLHTNLVPKEFVGDDYQITTPTDVIGQHIHLPKWDLSSADGSANGWNYEDATLSPGMVRERVAAINNFNREWGSDGAHAPGQPVTADLVPQPHPYFGSLGGHQDGDCLEKWRRLAKELAGGKGLDHLADEFDKRYGYPGQCDWLGARTTIQRWFSDPVVNKDLKHRGLGITFTHDHLGPSTHQQVGLYATMLSEPPDSTWVHNETGEPLYDTAKRKDGGPTSWQAVIKVPKDVQHDIDDHPETDDSHREFFLQFGDFQHAYIKEYAGVDQQGLPLSAIDPETHDATPAARNSFRYAINPSVRKPDSARPTEVVFPSTCPGPAGQKVPRPCPEAIAADDVGMMVVNYRNEPVGLRVFDPKAKAGDGLAGSQAGGRAGDLAFALQTRKDRAIADLNDDRGATHYPPLTRGVQDGDPFTPILRVYSGDPIRLKIQAGSHEHEHNAAINGMAWLQGGSGYGAAPGSGWRGAQNAGLSEQFTLASSILDYDRLITDRMYTLDSSQDGMWSGVWGVIRSYSEKRGRDRLEPLPERDKPRLLKLAETQGDSTYQCPEESLARRRYYRISAVLANRVLGNGTGATIPRADGMLDPDGGTLVYNNRTTPVVPQADPETGVSVGTPGASGPLHDPTAILLVRTEDLDDQGKLKPDAPVEPLVLRVNAGECLVVELDNRLSEAMPDLPGYLSLLGVVSRSSPESAGDVHTFNNNQIRPSAHIGLHPQLLSYAVQPFDGNNVGLNIPSTVGPGRKRVYQWYAGKLDFAFCTAAAKDERAFDRLREFRKDLRKRVLRPLHAITVLEDRAEGLVREQLGEMAGDPKLVGGVKAGVIDALRAAGCLGKDGKGLEQDRLEMFECGNVEKRSPRLREVLRGRLDQRLAELRKEAPVLDQLHAAVHRRRLNVFRRLFATSDPGRQFEEVVADLDERVTGILAEELGKSEDQGDEAEDTGATMALEEESKRIGADTTQLLDFGKNRDRPGRVGCQFTAVEFGGSNLTPPDRIKQGQKGAVGALVVLPPASSLLEGAGTNAARHAVDDPATAFLDERSDHQGAFVVGESPKRKTRLSATVDYPAGDGLDAGRFRDLAVIHQKALNLRYGNGAAVENLAAEGPGAPEDSHDAGQMAINYGSEPMWFRFGLPPNSDFGRGGSGRADPVGFGGVSTAWQAFSSHCCEPGGSATSTTREVGDPATGVFEAPLGMATRLHVLEPTGVGRGTVFDLHGHPWPRDPYLAEQRDERGFPIRGGGAASVRIGSHASVAGQHNPLQFWLGGQESVTPQAHFDMVLEQAGGTHQVAGDYLFRDHAGFGITNGLWGILRVQGEAAQQERRP